MAVNSNNKPCGRTLVSRNLAAADSPPLAFAFGCIYLHNHENSGVGTRVEGTEQSRNGAAQCFSLRVVFGTVFGRNFDTFSDIFLPSVTFFILFNIF